MELATVERERLYKLAPHIQERITNLNQFWPMFAPFLDWETRLGVAPWLEAGACMTFKDPR